MGVDLPTVSTNQHNMADNDNFFSRLPGFRDFADQALDDNFYQPLPEDWYIIITDIVSSTKAVEQGRYQEVNYVGAACIAALEHVLPRNTFPTAFGGDGASVAIPERYLTAAINALNSTQHWAIQSFALDLRVGVVPVAEITSRGESVEVGKLDLGNDNELAMFRGAGFELADKLIKDDSLENPFRRYADPSIHTAPDLSSLSCRWSPLQAEHDVMLCILVNAQTEGDLKDSRSNAVYRDVLDKINAIANVDSPATSPVKVSNLNFGLRLDSIKREMKSAKGSWIKRVTGVLGINLIAAVSFGFKLKLGSFDPRKYKEQMPLNSDYKRINGTLQLVLDCTQSQSDAIEAILEEEFTANNIYYGIHRSDSALITCITPDVTSGVHLHYIDGNNGGFHRAATALKKRLST